VEKTKMSFGAFRKLLQTPVHGLVAMAFVVAGGLSAISLVLQQTVVFFPSEQVQVVSISKARTAVLGVSTPAVVTWTNLTKVIAEGGDLEQTSGSCVGCADAGANSAQKITAGDGYFEFTIAPGSYHYVYAGLSTDVSASTSIIMPFALEISGSYVSVREQGTYRADTTFKAGDVFRVSVESGKVKYYKNGSVFYTSAAAPTYPLVADVSMQSVGSLLWGGKIAVSDGVATVPPPPAPAPVLPTPVAPPAPTVVTLELQDIKISNITDASATVSWVTTLPSDSYVRFGTTTRMTRSARNSGLVTNHVFQLTGLLPNSTYYYQVRSRADKVVKTSVVASFKTIIASTVPPPTPTPPPAPTPPPPAAAPVISSFTASSTSVTVGGSTTLSWSVTGATSLSINQGIGVVTGTTTKLVTPTATTTYTLTATNSSGSVTATATVNVNTVVPPVTSNVELPRVYVDSTYPTLPTSRTIRGVKAACAGATNCYTDFQVALDAANPGDEIVIDAGLQLLAPDGGFILRNGSKSNPNNYYTVVRGANMASLPTSGNRVSPSYASQMPKILSTGVTPALITSGPANRIRFVGVEVSLTAGAVTDAKAASATTNYSLVTLGTPTETNGANLPHHIIFDRVYVHGSPTQNVRRGFFINTGAVAVVDSYVSDFHEIGADTQAILGANGTGPYKVVNNYLEAAGENMMVGGLDVPIMPADFEVRNNYFYKPTKWMSGSSDYAGYAWVVKNLFETKFGLRWIIDGNIFENNWPMAQTGMAINLKSANQDGTMSFAETGHVTFTNNIVRHSTWAMSIHSKDAYSGGTAVNLNHVYIANNVFDDIGVWGHANTLQQDETPYVIFDHNTFLNERNNSAFVLYGNPSTNFVFTNNILGLGSYGIKGDSQASGTPSINQFLPGSVFSKNIFYGSNTSPYPTGNYMVSSASGVGFTNYNSGNGGNYALTSTSAYKNAGTDGKEIGANVNAVNTATACVMSGVCGGGISPVNPPSPVPVIASFSASPTSITAGQPSTLSWNVSGATSLLINQNIGTVTGTTSKTVAPTVTTTYTLTATNNIGSVTASVTVAVSAVAPTSIVDGYGDTLSATQFTGWFFSQLGDTSAIITYEDVSDATKTYAQTASRTLTRTDAEGWLRTTYGQNFTITQPLGFSINPSAVVTASGTYRIKSFKLNTSGTVIALGTAAQGTFTVAGQVPPATGAAITVNSAQRFQTMNGWEAVP